MKYKSKNAKSKIIMGFNSVTHYYYPQPRYMLHEFEKIPKSKNCMGKYYVTHM